LPCHVDLLLFASGGQGGSFRENRPPGPVKHPQKLLINFIRYSLKAAQNHHLDIFLKDDGFGLLSTSLV
jgi:hypothetical protein